MAADGSVVSTWPAILGYHDAMQEADEVVLLTDLCAIW